MESGRDATREAFLAAGVELYGSMAERLLRGFTAGAVADQAGFRRQTFYRYWETQADYVRDLIAHLLSDQEPAADGAMRLPARRQEAGAWLDLGRDIARYDFRRMAEDPRVRMRIGLATMAATTELGLEEHAQAYYEKVCGRMAEAIGTLLAELDRRPRPPLTERDLARLHQALLVGFVVLDLGVTDEPSSASLYEHMMIAIGQALTEEIAEGDPTYPE